ncbi:multidrug effflux MFS transporter [Pseudidiomarina sp.]|uniref:multidrug effflux MFS transporter n=1 Tax=Pseudidiomarina sp. TaxID=2081707 RepID=UPI003A97B3CB
MVNETSARENNRGRLFLLVLASLTALGPLSTDAYLPALPIVADSFDVTIHKVELSISLFLIGFAVGQLFGGPLSDHFGRRICIINGLFLYIIATIFIAFSEDIEGLWFFRAFQGVVAGITAVNVPAIVRDIYSLNKGAQILSKVSMIMMVTPIISPSIGLVITEFFGWRSIFIALFCYALLIIFFVVFFFSETKDNNTNINKIGFAYRYLIIIRSRKAVVNIFSIGCMYGSLFSYITASPWLYIEYFNLNQKLYPFFFAANVFSLIAFNWINIHFLNRHDLGKILILSKFSQFFMSLLLLIFTISLTEINVYFLSFMIMTVLCWHGMLVANSMARITNIFPKNSASATALAGFFGFTFGAICSALVGFFANESLIPMVTIMFTCSLLCISVSVVFDRESMRNII